MESSIGKKVLMALSGFFLMFFLLQHLVINLMSVFSPEAFNATSHFMGYNPLVQYLLQPILIFGIIFHLVMGVKLELENKKARTVKYANNNPNANSTWMSRNMVVTGLMILFFILAHMSDFWLHEMIYKYVDIKPEDPTRYWGELRHEMGEILHLVIYLLAFVFLALHLLHAFQSAFQSVGFNHNKYTPTIKILGKAYAILVPAGFAFIALYHFITQH